MGELTTVAVNADSNMKSIRDIVTQSQKYKSVDGVWMAQEGNMFFIMDLKKDNSKECLELWKTIVKSMAFGIYNAIVTYKNIPENNIILDERAGDVEEILTTKICTSLRKIRKREGNKKYTCRFELISKKNSIVNSELEIIPLTDAEKPSEYVINAKYPIDNLIYEIFPIYVNLTTNTVAPVMNTAFFIGEEKNAREIIEHNTHSLACGKFDKPHLMLFAQALTADAYATEHPVCKPNYSKFELATIFSLYKDMKYPTSMHTYSVEVSKKGVVTDPGAEEIENLIKPFVQKILVPTANRSDWPIIKFTKKEWASVDRYMKAQYGTPNVNFSLREKLSNSRYGQNFRMPVGNSEISISYDFIDDRIIFSFVEIMNEHVSVISQFPVTDIDTEGFVPYVVSSILLDHPYEMKRSELDYFNQSIMINNPDLVFDLYNDFIHMMVTMHDKPERNKVVSCQTQRRDPTRQQTKHVNPVTGQTTYITHRILAPAASAKEYMVKMSRDHKNREAIYVMEEWDRREHTRQLKSGKIVYVKAAHCKRRLEVQKADEIRIKL